MNRVTDISLTVKRIKSLAEKSPTREDGRPIQLMEVCGTHTVSIARNGIRSLLPPRLRLISGPGCPVCVTPTEMIDRAIAIAHQPGCVLCAFGDMMRVPASEMSLDEARARGASVRTVLSPRDCVGIAAENPGRKVVFFAVGFETTQAPIAAAVLEAEEKGVGNFLILPAMKRIPEALKFLLDDEKVLIDGFLLPGHVSAIIGIEPYGFIATKYGRPGVVSGFEGPAILEAVEKLLGAVVEGRADISNSYRGVVRDEGNAAAVKTIENVFEPEDSSWRGIGVIPGSGLKLRTFYSRRDASSIEVALPDPVERHGGCRCGDVLRGLIESPDCPHFGKSCNPESPLGPCMVSSEGACQAHYRYGRT